MRIHLSFLFASFVLLLSGCATAPVLTSISTPSGSVRGHAITGKVHGGQSPIAGASAYLYAANTTGYGNASVSLLNSSGSNTYKDTNGNYYVLTDANGNFSITGDYMCPSSTAQVYLYAVGVIRGWLPGRTTRRRDCSPDWERARCPSRIRSFL
jgi:hypothetical protein